tara:strand:+ start:226 stop:1032 length:807 start_codon:yes stop_codon:yes gene_type:complete
MRFFKLLLIKLQLRNNNAFIWYSESKSIKPVKKFKTTKLELIVSLDSQKKTLILNTKNFASGNLINNALLWGVRGNGKSTLIKAVFSELSKEYKNLKLIQLNKNNIFDIEYIYKLLENLPDTNFIIFIDDLSFEKIDSDYKIIKSTLDGSLQTQPKNIVLYITSNRRHLMPRDMIDNERSSAIHTDESVEEKISLSDRFGLWIGFHNFSQEDYLKIIKSYCNFYNIEFNKVTNDNAIKWSIQRGNRTGRTAWQFVINITSEKNLKLNL